MENGKLKSEIAKRTRDTAKLIELEAQKLAVGEMVLERLDAIVDLLRSAGFKVAVPARPAAQVVSNQPAPVVVQDAAPPAAPVKQPCALCGKEAVFDEVLQDGTRKYYCRPHGEQRAREKREEQQTSALMGQPTMFARPVNKNQPTAPKMIIHPAPQEDLLKGQFANNGPPANNVLGDD